MIFLYSSFMEPNRWDYYTAYITHAMGISPWFLPILFWRNTMVFTQMGKLNSPRLLIRPNYAMTLNSTTLVPSFLLTSTMRQIYILITFSFTVSPKIWNCRWLMICVRRLQYVNNDVIIVMYVEKTHWFLQFRAFLLRILCKSNVEYLAGCLVYGGVWMYSYGN